MAGKRLVDDHDGRPQGKRMRSIPSFASIIGDVMRVKSLNNFLNEMEPLIRKVVTEEVERAVQRTMPTLTRSSSLRRIQAPEPAKLKLMFATTSLPNILFTCNKIHDINDQPLQLVLVEQRGDQVTTPTFPPSPRPLKVEIVVVDGSFPSTDHETWTVDEFSRYVVKEREGKRPLLTKDLNYTIRGSGNCVTLGDIEFTDNSSWVPCRKFKLGARVVGESSHGDVRILEALTDAFIVKDHRGELYKKHYPPQLGDEVWRLEKISKEGKFHKRLAQAGVRNVQDFLKLSVINPNNLKKILGGKNGISERMWAAILKHAKTCNLGKKSYISTGPNYSIVLNPICEIRSIEIYGETYTKNDVDRLIGNAYENWDSLQEVDSVNETFQQPQGNMVGEYENDVQSGMPYELVVGGIIEFTNNGDLHIPFGDLN